MVTRLVERGEEKSAYEKGRIAAELHIDTDTEPWGLCGQPGQQGSAVMITGFTSD